MMNRVQTTRTRRAAVTLVGTLALALALGWTAPLRAAAPAAGAKAEARAAIAEAVVFLADAQNENGSFGVIPGAPEPGEVGITALIARALARLPEELKSEQSRALHGAAIAYIVANQQPDGSFSPPRTGLATYRTALALTALEASDRVRFADRIARAQRFLAGSQFSEDHGLEDAGMQSPYYGGWGYDRSGTRPDADMSNTHMALEALRKAGLSEQSEVWQRARVFLRRCQNRSESNDTPVAGVHVRDDGGFMYDPGLDRGKSAPSERPDGKVEVPSYASMTYAGLLSMIHAHLERDDPRVQAAWSWIRAHYTLEVNYGLGTRANPRAAKQGLYYYYSVFAKALDAWGEPVIVDAAGERHHWARELVLHLAALQRPDGSWVNSEPRWWEADPVLVTGYALGALATAYPWLGREEEDADER